MIKQDFQLNVGTMNVGLGGGEVAIIANVNKEDKPYLLFANLTKNKDRKAGDKFSVGEIESRPLVITFDNMEAVNVLKMNIENIERLLAEKEKKEEAPRFTVKTDSLRVLSKFKDSNPSPGKIITCLTNYQKNGKLDRDIVVNSIKQVKDGYVAYLVATYLGIDTVTVVAPNGIMGNFANGNNIVFKSPTVHVCVEYDTGTSRFALVIEGVRVGEFNTVAEMAAYLKSTFEYQKLFVPTFVYDGSFSNILESEMKSKNVK